MREAAHPLVWVLPTAVHPIGVELEVDQLRVGVGQDQVIDVVVADPLELLEVVVIVEPHSPMTGEFANFVEDRAAPQHEVQVAVRVELDVTADLGIAKLGLVVQRPRQNVELERVDVAAHDGHAKCVELIAQLGGIHAESDARIVACIVVGGLQAGESDLGDLAKCRPGVTRQ